MKRPVKQPVKRPKEPQTQDPICQIDLRIKIAVNHKEAAQQNNSTVKYKVEASLKTGHRSNKGDLYIKRRRILEERYLTRKHTSKTKTQRDRPENRSETRNR